MTYPTEHQLAGWADTLTRTNWTQVTRRLDQAIERDRRGGTAIPDGYPTGRTGITAGTLTAVEAAVVARQHARDEHHDRTVNAVGYLQDCLRALAACVTQLDRLENLARHDSAPEPGCSHHHAHGLREERYRGDLCRDCYDFKAAYRVLPPAELLEAKARGIRWTNATITRALAGEGSR